jgi:hypothetical protein
MKSEGFETVSIQLCTGIPSKALINALIKNATQKNWIIEFQRG